MTLTLYLHEISLVHTVVSLVETANLPFSDYKTEKCYGHTKEKYVHSLLYKLYYKFYSYDLIQSKYYIQQAIFS